MEVLPVAELKCPYTGAQIEIVFLGGANGRPTAYMGRVATPQGGYTTSAFPSREELVYFLMMRRGKGAPGVPSGPPKIEVRERTPPAPDAFEDVRGRQGELNDATEEFVRRVSAGGGK